MNKTTYDKALGSFKGLAIGDALGAPVEFLPRWSFRKVTDYRRAIRFGLNPGEWTDDTIMALCLGEALIENNGYNSYTVMDKYLDWYKNGYNSPNGRCFDIGIQTQKSLKKYSKKPSLNPVTTSAGNGTIMRLAPAAIVSLSLDDNDSKRLYSESAIDTHNSTEAALATQLFGFLLKNLLQGKTPEDAIQDANGLVNHTVVENIVQDMLFTNEKNAGNGGYVVDTLCTAWWCFTTTSSFEEAVLKSVNMGGDADTIAAVTGQLSGAYYGNSNIPEKFTSKLYRSEYFEELTKNLLQVTNGVIKTRL